jgi:hypothetical protein
VIVLLRVLVGDVVEIEERHSRLPLIVMARSIRMSIRLRAPSSRLMAAHRWIRETALESLLMPQRDICDRVPPAPSARIGAATRGQGHDNCRSTKVVVSDLVGVLITAHCDERDGTSTLRIAARYESDPRGDLRAFSLGFCGDAVISAEGPEGWGVSGAGTA